MLRAVVDTNVVLAASRTKHPRSPNLEMLTRWRAGEFMWLITDDIVNEYSNKLLALGKPESVVETFIKNMLALAETVPVRFFHLRHYPADADDIAFVLCALNGAASDLVTYDGHLLDAAVFYPEFDICGPLEFLDCLRA